MTSSPAPEASRTVPGTLPSSRGLQAVDPRQLLDPAQRAAVSYDGPAALVLGAPGTGKTTVAVELVARHVAGGVPAGSCLVLTSSRRSAEELRDRLLRRVGATTTEPLSRTPSGLAYAVLREAAVRHGEPIPRLLSGADQDLILRELLAGHRDGEGRVPSWPSELGAAVTTAGFRAELRDFLMRAAEHGIGPPDLCELGQRTGRPHWVAAAAVYQEYDDVLALARPGAADPAGLFGQAVQRLAADPELARRWQSRARVLVVDDAQELTAPSARLVAALAGPQSRLVVLADPDAATLTFRGGDPRLPRALAAVDQGAPTFVLGTGWRQRGTLRAVTAAVAGGIGTAGAGRHRRTHEPAPSDSALDRAPETAAVVAATFSCAQAQADYIAATLRSDHLIDGVPWSQLAVIVRSVAAASDLRAALTRRGVPVRVASERPHLPDEPAVAPLLAIVELAADLSRGRVDGVPPELVEPLLRSPYGGLDVLSWRRLRRLAAPMGLVPVGLARTTSSPVSHAAPDPQDPAPEPALDPVRVLARWLTHGVPRPVTRRYPGLGRVAAMIAAARSAAVWDSQAGAWAGRVSAAGVVWAAWSAAGVDDRWRALARRHGAVAARADRDLDTVLAVFDAADWYDEHGAGSGPDGFVRRLRGLDFTAEPLARRARRDCVEVATAHAAVGRAWRRVVVAGVQDGSWPDLRIRGSILGGAELADVLAGCAGDTRAAREVLRSDETRLFHVAVSRASEALRVTAIDTDDEVPSSLFRAVAAVPGVAAVALGEALTGHDGVTGDLTLAAVTARLRRMAGEHPDPVVRDGAARRLAALTAASVPGADPEGWWEQANCSDGRPRRAGGVGVRVSPSALEDFTRCPLRWLTRAAGGTRPRPAGPASVGDLVHQVLAEAPDAGDLAALRERLDLAWPRLGLTPGWLERRSRGDAEAMLDRAARYLRQAETLGRREVARELAVTAPVGEHAVTARFDRVEQDADGRLRVVDFKTGASKPTAAELDRSPQLGAYQVALGSLGEVAGASMVQLGRAAGQHGTVQDQPALADSGDPGWAERMITQSAAGMAGAWFAVRKGPWCRTCEAAAACPAGGGSR